MDRSLRQRHGPRRLDTVRLSDGARVWLRPIRADDEAVEAMMHPEDSPFAFPGPEGSGILSGNDPGFLSDPALRAVDAAPALERPPGWVENDALWQRAASLAQRMGYR